MNRKILNIALPSIVSTLTVPLLGLVDLGLSGHLGRTEDIGAIAVGATIFNLLYWLFAFLRMGTGGMTSQASGRNDHKALLENLVRPLTLALLCAGLIVLLQRPIEYLAFWLIGPSAEVAHSVSVYYRILIYGAPALLATYCFAGWFLGVQNAHIPMIVSIAQNLINILISVWFVTGFGWGVAGIAWGTLIAQYMAFLMYLTAWIISSCHLLVHWKDISILQHSKLMQFLRTNRDLFLRTLCMVTVQLGFTATGARLGDDTLAANAILFQFFTLFSYFMDGFAYAGESLGGFYIGAKNLPSLRVLTSNLFRWGWGITLIATLVYLICGDYLMHLLTDDLAVIDVAKRYFAFVLLIPVVSFAAFLYDGLFIGAVATREMFKVLFYATMAFICVGVLLFSTLGNYALWLAFIVFLLTRSVLQKIYYRRILSNISKIV
ncbi:MAG: MATE family efflux transporter [Alloprevotella sp.]|nr:MATE family efflux transporter [Alloprevotella sp.]